MTINKFKSTLALLLAVLILSACSNRDEDDTLIPGADAPDTTAQQTTDTIPPENDPPAPTDEIDLGGKPFVTVQNPGNLTITAAQTERDYNRAFAYDERYMLVFTWDWMTDKGGSEMHIPDGLRLKVLDTATGEFTDDMHFAGTEIPTEINYGSKLCWLTTGNSAWTLALDGGKIKDIQPYKGKIDARTSLYFTSPDGKWKAYEEHITRYDPGNSYGKIMVSNGEVTEMILNNAYTADAQMYRTYRVLGFLDNTRLAYSITGYESSVGWGIYDVVNKTHITGIGDPKAVYDGFIYMTDSEDYEPKKLSRVDADGKVTVLAAKGATDLPIFSEDGADQGGIHYPIMMRGGYWLSLSDIGYADGQDITRVRVFDAAAKNLLAELLVGRTGDTGSEFWFTDSENLTVVKK